MNIFTTIKYSATFNAMCIKGSNILSISAIASKITNFIHGLKSLKFN